jgi:hypothetical protein
MCPHAIYVSSCYYEKVLRNGKGERVLEPQTPESLEVLSVVLGTEAVVTRGASLLLLYMSPHATMYVSSSYFVCVLILLLRRR